MCRTRRVPPTADRYYHHAAAFWAWTVPYNIAIKGCFLALFLVRGHRATIALLAAQILFFIAPYWHAGEIERLRLGLLGY